MARRDASAWDPWTYGGSVGVSGARDLVGFGLEATDGHIGKVDEATDDLGSSYVVVDTGPWIFGKGDAAGRHDDPGRPC